LRNWPSVGVAMLAVVLEVCAGIAGGLVKLLFSSSLSPGVSTVLPSSSPFALTSISVQVVQASAQTSSNDLPSK
jgi:hypothetical protein